MPNTAHAVTLRNTPGIHHRQPVRPRASIPYPLLCSSSVLTIVNPSDHIWHTATEALDRFSQVAGIHAIEINCLSWEQFLQPTQPTRPGLLLLCFDTARPMPDRRQLVALFQGMHNTHDIFANLAVTPVPVLAQGYPCRKLPTALMACVPILLSENVSPTDLQTLLTVYLATPEQSLEPA